MYSYPAKLSILILAVSSLYAGNFEIDQSRSELAATMHASPSHDFTTVAKDYSYDIQIDPDSLTVEKAVCSFDFADLDSGKKSRDSKMRKWIEVGAHPSASFAMKNQLPDNETGEHVAEGTFSMHGVDRPITITYTLRREGEQLILDGRSAFNHEDWGLEKVRLLLFSVDPVLKPHFHLVGTLAK